MYKIIGADQKEYGPVSADDLRKWVAEGRVNAQTMVQAEGQTGWQPLASFAELAAPVATASNNPPPSPTPGAFSPQAGTKIPNYLVQSILVTLCCCLPGGIVAIIYAAQVNSKQAAGDLAGAMQASQKAKKWCWIAFGVGIAVNLIVAVAQFIMAAGGKFGQ